MIFYLVMTYSVLKKGISKFKKYNIFQKYKPNLFLFDLNFIKSR